MVLDDQVIIESNSIKFSVRTFINYNTPGSGLIFLESPIGFTRATKHDLGDEAAEFVKKLKRGDKVLVLEYDGKVEAVIGPLNEQNCYIRSELNH